MYLCVRLYQGRKSCICVLGVSRQKVMYLCVKCIKTESHVCVC